MFQEQKNKAYHDDWRPTADIQDLKIRAAVMAEIRNFFAKKGVLEVETPLMCRHTVTNPYIASIPVQYGSTKEPFYLQTSPEYAMKRLLAAGSGSIYQICKAFRNSEEGRLHNPEFTMLEWYRLGFDHHDLMDDVDELLHLTLGSEKADRITYATLFLQVLNLDPHSATLEQLKNCAMEKGIQLDATVKASFTIDDWLDILMTHCIEPQLGFERPVMVFDFPASKAALAKVRPETPPVAERVEVYVVGIELANGFHELTDAAAQQQRFEDDLKQREQLGLPVLPIDTYLLEALESGLPASAGIALGVDRLMLLRLKKQHIKQVVPFTIDRV
jgi:lysyl-tRNA synthetase class 2